MAVARNVVFDPRLAPGGGATEMAISVGLSDKAKTIEGVEGWPFKTVGEAMEVIPRTLIQNCGGNTIRLLAKLRVSFLLGDHPINTICSFHGFLDHLIGQTRRWST